MKKLIIVIIIFFILFNIYKIANYFYITNKTEKEFNNLAENVHIENNVEIAEENEEIVKSEEIKNINNLINKNQDMFGWIHIEDTNIDYPVMKSEEYLYKDFNGNYSLSGTPFIDKNFKLGNTIGIIHGHNMKNGTMFNNLLNYQDETFFKQHNNIKLYTKDNEKIYEVYAIIELNITNEEDLKFYSKINIENDKDFKNYIEKIDEKAILKSKNIPKDNSNIIALSTCDNNNEKNRIVVIGLEKG